MHIETNGSLYSSVILHEQKMMLFHFKPIEFSNIDIILNISPTQNRARWSIGEDTGI